MTARTARMKRRMGRMRRMRRQRIPGEVARPVEAATTAVGGYALSD